MSAAGDGTGKQELAPGTLLAWEGFSVLVRPVVNGCKQASRVSVVVIRGASKEAERLLGDSYTSKWWPEQWAGEVQGNAGILRYVAGKIDWALHLIGRGGQVRVRGRCHSGLQRGQLSRK